MNFVFQILFVLVSVVSTNLLALPRTPTATPSNDSWLLPSFTKLAMHNPERLIKLSSKLYSKERMKLSASNARFAGDWQHRSAALTSLSQVLLNSAVHSKLKEEAKSIIKAGLLEDPSLLVRDAAAESIGQILKSSPRQSSQWKGLLENAFLDSKNVVQGEGLFIRETILKIFRESNLKPSKKIIQAAKADLNSQVGYMLRDWDTQSFDSL